LNNTAVDRKTLAWIKAEVEETLKEVYHVPDEFAGNLDNTAPIQSCIEPLRRVRGAVEMVDIHGATMLALELEHLAQALLENEVKHKRDAAECLAAGMLQLPGYLESLYHGQPDIPLILLPQLNDLLAVQDKDLLSEGEFFFPDLSINVPILVDNEPLVRGDLATVAKKLRPGYLSGLLGVIREQDVTDSLEKLIIVVDNLLIASTTEKARQLWWIASGVIDSLYEQGIETSIAIKILLGRLDQQIKRVIDYGEEILTQDPPIKMCKNLLYYVAQSESQNDRVIDLKKAFRLDYPDDSSVKKAREDLYGFNVNLIGSIVEQVREELNKVKDNLDLNMRVKSGGTIDLEPVLSQFDTISNALEMLGMSTEKSLINEFKNFIASKISLSENLDNEDYMNVAAAVLHIESSLSEFGSNIDGSKVGEILPRAEYEKLLCLVSEEIINDSLKIRDCISQYSEEPTNVDLILDVPQLLENVKGAMRILNHDLQANLAQSIQDYVNYELIENKIKLNEKKLDYLADAIIGLEYYYEAMLEQNVAPEIGLKAATQSITQLGYPPQTSTWDLTHTTDSLLSVGDSFS